jgi:hypothetical protein
MFLSKWTRKEKEDRARNGLAVINTDVPLNDAINSIDSALEIHTVYCDFITDLPYELSARILALVDNPPTTQIPLVRYYFLTLRYKILIKQTVGKRVWRL